MNNVSVPLPNNMITNINNLIKKGVASSKAELIRMAISKFIEEQAVNAVLNAEKDPNLAGDLDDLTTKTMT